MSSLLRQALSRNAPTFRFGTAGSGGLRWEGNLPIATNKYIEEWNARREALEEEFRWSAKNILILCITCVGVPAGLFNLTIRQWDVSDDAYGRQRRRFWPRDSPKDD